MSHVQGTMVEITGKFLAPGTRTLVDPDDVVATIIRPDGTTITVLRFSDGQITRVDVGIYTFTLDSTPAAGWWEYQLESLGPDAVVKRRQIHITPRHP
jgi:hypothetical protein